MVIKICVKSMKIITFRRLHLHECHCILSVKDSIYNPAGDLRMHQSDMLTQRVTLTDSIFNSTSYLCSINYEVTECFMNKYMSIFIAPYSALECSSNCMVYAI